MPSAARATRSMPEPSHPLPHEHGYKRVPFVVHFARHGAPFSLPPLPSLQIPKCHPTPGILPEPLELHFHRWGNAVLLSPRRHPSLLDRVWVSDLAMPVRCGLGVAAVKTFPRSGPHGLVAGHKGATLGGPVSWPLGVGQATPGSTGLGWQAATHYVHWSTMLVSAHWSV
jgi:hypothetical protein